MSFGIFGTSPPHESTVKGTRSSSSIQRPNQNYGFAMLDTKLYKSCNYGLSILICKMGIVIDPERECVIDTTIIVPPPPLSYSQRSFYRYGPPRQTFRTREEIHHWVLDRDQRGFK
jgi:hypothetical protein